MGLREDFERSSDVCHSYELQVAASARGVQLGKVLIDEFERIGQRRKMDKGMLTVLKREPHEHRSVGVRDIDGCRE